MFILESIGLRDPTFSCTMYILPFLTGHYTSFIVITFGSRLKMRKKLRVALAQFFFVFCCFGELIISDSITIFHVFHDMVGEGVWDVWVPNLLQPPWGLLGMDMAPRWSGLPQEEAKLITTVVFQKCAFTVIFNPCHIFQKYFRHSSEFWDVPTFFQCSSNVLAEPKCGH